MSFAKALPIAVFGAALMVSSCAAPPKRAPAKSKPAAAASKKAPAKRAAKAKTESVEKTPPAKVAPAKPALAPTPQQRYSEALELLKANQLPEAEQALRAVIKDYPKLSGPRTNLGIVYARTDRRPQAQTQFAQAIKANPRNAVAHNWLGVLARESGNYTAAEQAYKQALAADPNYTDAQLNLAILYDQYLKRPYEALAAYKRYAQLAGPEDLRAAVWVAELESRLPPPAPVQAAPPTPAKPAAGAPARPAPKQGPARSKPPARKGAQT